jgi:hypothetical protein
VCATVADRSKQTLDFTDLPAMFVTMSVSEPRDLGLSFGFDSSVVDSVSTNINADAYSAVIVGCGVSLSLLRS